ncbi:histone acetyltransferase [Halobacteriales archaeon SW_12_71_31]|nr:MAG: histone acetyltransferase [Halobacteriales archaeon SW_12_71_31]
MSDHLPVDGVQPSQPYVDAARLRSALEWFDADDPSYDPIPVIRLGEHDAAAARLDEPLDRPVALDGHTRALLAHLAGAETLRVERAEPDPALDLDLYAECVGWCHEAGVVRVRDLVGRVVSRETFEREWTERCHASPLYTASEE